MRTLSPVTVKYYCVLRDIAKGQQGESSVFYCSRKNMQVEVDTDIVVVSRRRAGLGGAERLHVQCARKKYMF